MTTLFRTEVIARPALKPHGEPDPTIKGAPLIMEVSWRPPSRRLDLDLYGPKPSISVQGYDEPEGAFWYGWALEDVATGRVLFVMSMPSGPVTVDLKSTLTLTGILPREAEEG